MSLHIADQSVPLIEDDTGVVRVGGSRVTLETIIGAFRRGTPAEEIARQYPIVSLVDVYAVIDYYRQHQAEVNEYLHDVDLRADRLRARIEQRFPTDGVRENLLARRSQHNGDRHAAPGV